MKTCDLCEYRVVVGVHMGRQQWVKKRKYKQNVFGTNFLSGRMGRVVTEVETVLARSAAEGTYVL